VARVAGARPARGRAAADPEQVSKPAEPDLVVVGRLGRPQGIRGELTVEVRTDDPDQRFADGAVLATEPPERGPLTVAGSRQQNLRLIVSFTGVEDRTAAEALRDTLLLVDAARLPAPEDDDTFHDVALRGLFAELAGGERVGQVVDVLHLPHGDVLVVARPEPAPELLVPFVRAIVPTVDVAGGRVVLDPPPGLLELGDRPG